MPMKPSYYYRQSAAVPVRVRHEVLEVLLITTRKGRWIVPKGIVEPGWDAQLSAAREAWEEAGVLGPVSSDSLGRYEYEKWGGICTVDVFVLRVRQELPAWPDSRFREREWVDVRRATRRIEEQGLRHCIERLAGWLASDSQVEWLVPDSSGWIEEEAGL
jgi:phosphohistidine phosphatase